MIPKDTSLPRIWSSGHPFYEIFCLELNVAQPGWFQHWIYTSYNYRKMYFYYKLLGRSCAWISRHYLALWDGREQERQHTQWPCSVKQVPGSWGEGWLQVRHWVREPYPLPDEKQQSISIKFSFGWCIWEWTINFSSFPRATERRHLETNQERL